MKKKFTIVDALVVVAIIAISAVMLLPLFGCDELSPKQKEREKRRKEILKLHRRISQFRKYHTIRSGARFQNGQNVGINRICPAMSI